MNTSELMARIDKILRRIESRLPPEACEVMALVEAAAYQKDPAAKCIRFVEMVYVDLYAFDVAITMQALEQMDDEHFDAAFEAHFGKAIEHYDPDV